MTRFFKLVMGTAVADTVGGVVELPADLVVAAREWYRRAEHLTAHSAQHAPRLVRRVQDQLSGMIQLPMPNRYATVRAALGNR